LLGMSNQGVGVLELTAQNVFHLRVPYSSSPDALKPYKAFGRLLGLAVLEGVCFGASLSVVILKQLLQRTVEWTDVQFIDASFYRSMQSILSTDFDSSPLELYFTVTTKTGGVCSDVELVSGGSRKKVDNCNKLDFVTLQAMHFMLGGRKPALGELVKGFRDVMSSKLVTILHTTELNDLLAPQVFSWQRLQSVMDYDSCNANSPIIKWFWQAVQGLDVEGMRMLLLFWTGNANVSPFLKKGDITIDFASQKRKSLPEASTCSMLLMLPNYATFDELQRGLLVAIQYGAAGYDHV